MLHARLVGVDFQEGEQNFGTGVDVLGFEEGLFFGRAEGAGHREGDQ